MKEIFVIIVYILGLLFFVALTIIFFIDNYYAGKINALQLNRDYKGWWKDHSTKILGERGFNYFALNFNLTILIFKNDILKEEKNQEVIKLIHKRCKIMKIFYILFFSAIFCLSIYITLDSYTTLFEFMK